MSGRTHEGRWRISFDEGIGHTKVKAGFDYKTAAVEDIVRFSAALRGKRLGGIDAGSDFVEDPVRGKGQVGLLLERFFGIPPNSISGADFPGAGVELKGVPVVRSGRNLRIKERTVISMINYMRIIEEDWDTAHVRGKLHILFVFFEHIPGISKASFPVLDVVLWRPTGTSEALIRDDWERVRRKVAEGRAHELSEGDGRLLGPCTKGSRASAVVAQPVTHLSPTAKTRAFALKPSFTLSLLKESLGRRVTTESLIDDVGMSTHNLEGDILRRFEPFVGRKLGDVAAELNITLGAGKHRASRAVRAVLGLSDPKNDIKEFAQMGISTRVPRINAAGYPYEAISFPAFKHVELAEEDWVNSTLLAQLDGLFLLPLRGETRKTPAEACVIDPPFLWRPSVEELDIAQQEWTVFRNLVAEGNASRLPKESETRMLHIRPHARNKADTDVAPGNVIVTKKSFWLNKGFLAELLQRHL